MSLRTLIALSLTAWLGGCTASRPAAKSNVAFPSKIAILPLDNMSVDLQGPVVVRALMENHLIGSNYDTLDLDETDQKLKNLGITDGGQLKALTAQKLGEALKADGLLYGELLEFKNMNVGVYAKRTVEARFLLVDAKTGAKLWEATKKKANANLALTGGGIKSQLTGGYAEKTMETIRKSPLRQESEDVVRQLVKDLNKTRRGGR